jgi:hypothetical protein
VHEGLGRAAVDVDVVEDRDVTGTQPAQQVARTTIDPRHADDPWQFAVRAAEQPGELHEPMVTHIARGSAANTPNESGLVSAVTIPQWTD